MTDSDTHLTAWVAAAESGRLPSPHRDDRWQPLRAGVVSLWEFEAVEYWYADGWVQLSGRNETGKSSLMALTTLIPWLADTASTNIDTLGNAGKQFRFYVEPTGHDGDRRPTNGGAHRGWLWVEYGRLHDGRPRYFTTLLFAEVRSASKAVNLTWCTADGPRVREQLNLAHGRVVGHPKDMAAVGFEIHPTATAYKQEVATTLLGSSVERLKAAGKMLRVTRTPKLGAELKVGFVSEHLRTALPELDRVEVDALAAGWDQLDHVRADLDAAGRAGDTLERFRTSAWLPWVRAEVRRRADTASRTRTIFDRVTRDERDATDAVTALERRNEEISAAKLKAERDESTARAAKEELHNSARYQDARARVDTLEARKRTVTRLQSESSDRRGALERAKAEETGAAAEVSAHESEAAQAHAAAGSARDAAAQAADEAGVKVPSGEIDLPLLEQRLSERDRAIQQGRRLLRSAQEAHQRAERDEEVAAHAASAAQEARDNAEAAWLAADSTREALVSAIAQWASTLTPNPTSAVVDAWLDSLPTSVVDANAPEGVRLREAVSEAWFDPARTALVGRRAEAERQAEAARKRSADLAERIRELESAPTPVFAPPVAWARRSRPDAAGAGAPLWTLLDPAPSVTDHELARVEAALAAQGLLDAWVTPDGVYQADRDGDDLVLAAAGAPPVDGAATLRAVLVPAEGPSELSATASGLLERVRLLEADEPIPADGLAVGRDGRWRAGVLAGRAAAPHDHAEWLGESARQAGRRRQIADLRQQQADVDAEASAAQAAADEAAQLLTKLNDQFSVCPRDDELHAHLIIADERQRMADKAATKAAREAARAAEHRVAAELAAAALHEHCAQSGLPHDDAGLDRAFHLVADARSAARQVRSALQALTKADAALASARSRLETRTDHRERAARALAEVDHSLAAAEETVRTLEATMQASDQEILAELERLRAAEVAAKAKRERHQHELFTVGTGLGEARATLRAVEQRRVEATAARNQAFADFRVVIDRGLAVELDLELPDPHASTVDRVREQVAETRRQVEPPRWPDDADQQAAEERRLASRLTEAVHQARVDLEAGGRSIQLGFDDAGLPVVEVRVDATGALLGPREATAKLAQIQAELDSTYNERVRATLDELLGSTFLDHLRNRVGAADALVKHINTVLAAHPVVTTNTSLRIKLEPESEHDHIMLDAMRGSGLVNPEAAEHVRQHLKSRVEQAKEQAARDGVVDWKERLVETLDYRRWQRVVLQRKVGASGSWSPLTTQKFAEMSGGARAVTLVLPLVATLAALYEDMNGAPRPLWLDEAFDGLDSANRAMVMDLFRSFDLDVLVAGPNRLVNVETVPTAAIYQVVRAPAPDPGADLTLELWAGGTLRVVDLPSVPLAGPADHGVDSPEAQEALL